MLRDVLILDGAQEADFARDGLIIYIDTDDAISQLPGSLSDMFHQTELRWPTSDSQPQNLIGARREVDRGAGMGVTVRLANVGMQGSKVGEEKCQRIPPWDEFAELTKRSLGHGSDSPDCGEPQRARDPRYKGSNSLAEELSGM
ncbi:unnamed protein product [Pleuronectes platessa]|uniref:Uncharacterized protein n=1 Tax=Pleuronectes platessa TaxID=8262 RepID=A0A9N7W351_PLEPL|nr:unnamed protein product [Pleuronectes platessa]